MSAVLHRLAPAKVNLYLHVTGKRADGYHLLDSLVVFARDAGDEISFSPASDVTLETIGPNAELAGDPAQNLVLRAALGLRELTGCRKGVAIRLSKTLPVAAGLGGGSSDAATTLNALCAFWDVAPDAAALDQLAVRLGADVPVCLRGRSCRMTGIGELIEEMPPLPPAWLVLVNPGVPLATRDVFRALAGRYSSEMPLERQPASAHDLALMLRRRHNDLEPPARFLQPAVDQALTAIADTRHSLLARMSGSGATCFGLYASEQDARSAVATLKLAHRDWWVVASSI